MSIVAFKKGQLRVLAHAWDRNLGGRDLDELLFEHFCKEFGDKHKIDIKSNARASFRLRLACEKVRSHTPHLCLSPASNTFLGCYSRLIILLLFLPGASLLSFAACWFQFWEALQLSAMSVSILTSSVEMLQYTCQVCLLCQVVKRPHQPCCAVADEEGLELKCYS